MFNRSKMLDGRRNLLTKANSHKSSKSTYSNGHNFVHDYLQQMLCSVETCRSTANYANFNLRIN